MSTKEIEGNILIGGFMGEKQELTSQINFWILLPGYSLKRWINVVDLKYHTSWDWLMPVCKKIIEMYFDRREDIFKGLHNCDINETWKAVVRFIKFWNDDTQEKIIWSEKL